MGVGMESWLLVVKSDFHIRSVDVDDDASSFEKASLSVSWNAESGY